MQMIHSLCFRESIAAHQWLTVQKNMLFIKIHHQFWACCVGSFRFDNFPIIAAFHFDPKFKFSIEFIGSQNFIGFKSKIANIGCNVFFYLPCFFLFCVSTHWICQRGYFLLSAPIWSGSKEGKKRTHFHRVLLLLNSPGSFNSLNYENNHWW